VLLSCSALRPEALLEDLQGSNKRAAPAAALAAALAALLVLSLYQLPFVKMK
jgi:hypothetical protein